MFFHEKLKNINKTDRVLEIGPGGSPHSRSDVFLEMQFSDEAEAAIQRSHCQPLKTEKPVFYYDGTTFPFSEKEFYYIICAQVLEHVADVEFFLNELQRVGRKGYIEFPTIYYDYLYDMPTHVNFLLFDNNIIYHMKKDETDLNKFKQVTQFFNSTLELRYTHLIKHLKGYFFQGFEWEGVINSEKVADLSCVTYDVSKLNLKEFSRNKENKILREIKRCLGKIGR
jgi:2-polyprenyl-3-methyl-5-hydroxy-6-metoxy-1,4-benzoquinol methylase